MKKDGKSLALMRDVLVKTSEIDGVFLPMEPDELEKSRTFVLHTTKPKAPKSTRGRKGPSAKECSIEAFITAEIAADSGDESSDSDNSGDGKSRKKRPTRTKRLKSKKNQKKKKKKKMGKDSDLAGSCVSKYLHVCVILVCVCM